MTSTENWKNDLADFLKGRGKIQQLAELTAVQDLKAKAEEIQRNSEAEASYVRRHVWDEQANNKNGEDVGTTILGDITQPPTVVVTNQQSNLLPIALLAASTMFPVAGLGAAAAAYFLTKPQPAPTPEFQDSSAIIGLKRLEDLNLQNKE